MPKITIIGGGSAKFVRELVVDMFSYDALQGIDICLMDIDRGRVELSEQLVGKIIGDRSLPASVTSTLDQRAALDGADYVFITIMVGGYDKYKEDVAIPVVTEPGDVAQVDFGYAGRVYDPSNGMLRKAWVFVLVLAYSRGWAGARTPRRRKSTTGLVGPTGCSAASMRRGPQPVFLQDVLGHGSLPTTTTYLRRLTSDEAIDAALRIGLED